MLKKLTPNLMVENVNRTVEFYRDVLGFEVTATVPEDGIFGWANTRNGAVEIMFQARLSLEEEIPLLKDRPVGASLSFYIDAGDQVTTLYEQLKDKVQLAQDLHTTFYGATEFAIVDCNGYILAFAGPA